MRLGVVFPQVEIEADPGAIRHYIAAVEELGFDHVLVYDHVTGVDPADHPDFVTAARTGGATSPKPYDVHDRFHEVMVLMGFLAAISHLELVTGVLVLPQRQTALAAKQAAEVDLLSGGRLRLGVGIGWNKIEFRSMGRDFERRGAMIEGQVELLRRYWIEGTVRFESDLDWADGVGISPPPVQRPIPVWIGAGPTRRALERAGRIGDGWLPVGVDPTALGEQFEIVRAAAREAGRDPDALGIQGRLEHAADRSEGAVAAELADWQTLGATHVAVNTMRCGLAGAEGHIEALRRIASEAIGT
jgi:probable F420-dependent oxidoreductase